MKILRKSNYDLESFAQSFVAENVTLPEKDIWIMCKALNDQDPNGPLYFCPVADDYVLSRGMADLV